MKTKLTLFITFICLLSASLSGQTVTTVNPEDVNPDATWESGYQSRLSFFLNNADLSYNSGNAGVDDGKHGFNMILAKIAKTPANKSTIITTEGANLLSSTWTGNYCSPFSHSGLAGYYYYLNADLPAAQKTSYDTKLNTPQSFPYRCPSGEEGWYFMMRDDLVMDPVYAPDNPNAGNGTEHGKGGYKNSENFHWMMRCAGYLFSHNDNLNKPSDPEYQNRKDFFDAFVKNVVRSVYNAGRLEWNSNNYWGHTFYPLIVLHDNTTDPAVKNMIKATMDWMVLELAIHQIDGIKIGTDVRAKPGFFAPFAGSSWGYAYYYFYDNTHQPTYSGILDGSLIGSMDMSDFVGYVNYTSYRPPQAIIDIAQKKFNYPVEIQSAKPYYYVDHDDYADWKGNTERSRKWEFETIFQDENYVLSSLASNTPNSYLSCPYGNFYEQAMWSLGVTGTDSGAVQLFGSAGVNENSKYYYSTGRKPEEEIGQFRNVMIRMTKDIDKISTHIPWNTPIEMVGNKLFADLGNDVYVAIIPYNETGKTTTTSYSARHKSHNWTFDTTGYGATIMEVGNAREFTSYSNFKTTITNSASVSAINDSTIEYISGSGHTVRMQYMPIKTHYNLQFVGDSCIETKAGVTPMLWGDGNYIDYDQWETYKVTYGDPIVKQDWGSGKLQVASNDNGLQIEIDPVTSTPTYGTFNPADMPTENNQIQTEKLVNIYPSPADDKIFVNANKWAYDGYIDVEIISITGETIMKDKILSADYIDVSSVSSGVYLIKVSGNGKSQVSKIIIN